VCTDPLADSDGSSYVQPLDQDLAVKRRIQHQQLTIGKQNSRTNARRRLQLGRCSTGGAPTVLVDVQVGDGVRQPTTVRELASASSCSSPGVPGKQMEAAWLRRFGRRRSRRCAVRKNRRTVLEETREKRNR
jgi:hypothetical protein